MVKVNKRAEVRAKGNKAKAKKPAKGAKTVSTPREPKADAAIWSIRALDPTRKCGPGTSVERLLRVDEKANGRTTAHLVFLDRHGWYCEHGPSCPAVLPARKYKG